MNPGKETQRNRVSAPARPVEDEARQRVGLAVVVEFTAGRDTEVRGGLCQTRE